jgi:hypothetical protein
VSGTPTLPARRSRSHLPQQLRRQAPGAHQLAWFLGQHRGDELPRCERLGQITADVVSAIERLAQDQCIPIVHFEKEQRKETIAEPYFAEAAGSQREGVVMIGVAQERANVSRPPAKHHRGQAGGSRPPATAPSSSISTSTSGTTIGVAQEFQSVISGYHRATRNPGATLFGLKHEHRYVLTPDGIRVAVF